MKEVKLNSEMVQAIKDVAKEKGLETEILFQAVEESLKVAYKRIYGGSVDGVRVDMNRETGETHIFALLKVVEGEAVNSDEISLADAKASDSGFEAGDYVEREVMVSSEFGRTAALAAKSALLQKIRDAEMIHVNTYFQSRKNDIVMGVVQRKEGSSVFFDLGKADKIEGVLVRSEQIPGEHYNAHDRMKIYVLDVRRGRSGPQVLVSRTHPGLVKKLFEREVPEIEDGTVEIVSVSREPGARSKIAVYTSEKDVDPVGACVGPRGSRVQVVVDELNGEKIDIVKYSDNPAEYVANALSPSQVIMANSTDNEKEKVCKVVVPDNQLSLAIGKEGQNARLAAKLTGWKIDIKSESQAHKEEIGEQTEEVFDEADEANTEQPGDEESVE